jgi:hypothetical protein
MGIVDLLANAFINDPVLDLTMLSSNKQIIFIDLKQFSWLVCQLESFEIVFSASLDIENGDEDECLSVVGEAQNGCRALNNGLVPANFNHLILITTNSSALILLDDYWGSYLLLLFLNITIGVITFFTIFWLVILRWHIFLWWWNFFVFNRLPLCILISLTFILIDVVDFKDSIWMLSGRPDHDISVNTSSGEIFILEFSERNKLNNLVIVGHLDNIVLISLVETNDVKITIAHRRDEDIFLLSSNSHAINWLVSFISVTATLKILIPYLERFVIG